jgi:hypothetical protein
MSERAHEQAQAHTVRLEESAVIAAAFEHAMKRHIVFEDGVIGPGLRETIQRVGRVMFEAGWRAGREESTRAGTSAHRTVE